MTFFGAVTKAIHERSSLTLAHYRAWARMKNLYTCSINAIGGVQNLLCKVPIDCDNLSSLKHGTLSICSVTISLILRGRRGLFLRRCVPSPGGTVSLQAVSSLSAAWCSSSIEPCTYISRARNVNEAGSPWVMLVYESGAFSGLMEDAIPHWFDLDNWSGKDFRILWTTAKVARDCGLHCWDHAHPVSMASGWISD